MALSTNPADWTVDKLLSVLQSIDTRTADAIEARYAARDQWQRLVAQAASIPDSATRSRVQGQLMEWRHRDLANAQRLSDFDAKLYKAKQLVKSFLQSIHRTVPDYLGLAPAVLIPVAVIVAVVGANLAIFLLERGNAVQRQGLSAAEQIISDPNLTPDQKLAQLKEVNKAAQKQDPLGITPTLEAALPIALIAAAVYLAPMFLRKRSAA